MDKEMEGLQMKRSYKRHKKIMIIIIILIITITTK